MRKVVLASILCAFVASPAMADLSISYDKLHAVYGTSTLTLSVNLGAGTKTSGSIARDEAPFDSAAFDWNSYSGGNFSLTGMTLGSTTTVPTVLRSAAGTGGTLTLTDTDGTADTITAAVSGNWVQFWTGNAWGNTTFTGNLTSLTFADNGTKDGYFNGQNGSKLLLAGETGGGGSGTLTLALNTNQWFTSSSFSNTTTGAGGKIAVVPVPAAVLIGMLGLGVAGFKLRKHA
jgi:hypothetical protein